MGSHRNAWIQERLRDTVVGQDVVNKGEKELQFIPDLELRKIGGYSNLPHPTFAQRNDC